MTELEITERLIRAAEIGEVGQRVGPAPLRAQQLPYIHSQADMNGWGKKPGERDMLLKEDADAHAAHREKFFSTIPDDPRSVSEAEEALTWYSLVEDHDHRAALAGWVGCMADNKRRFFKDWCKRAGISEKTGRKRKDAAIARIYAHHVRSAVQNCDLGQNQGLPDTPEIDNYEGRIGDAWRFDPYPIKQSSTVVDFSWSQKRNERRRQQAAKQRKAA